MRVGSKTFFTDANAKVTVSIPAPGNGNGAHIQSRYEKVLLSIVFFKIVVCRKFFWILQRQVIMKL